MLCYGAMKELCAVNICGLNTELCKEPIIYTDTVYAALLRDITT